MSEDLNAAATADVVLDLSANVASLCLQCCSPEDRHAQNEVARLLSDVLHLQDISKNAKQLLDGPRKNSLETSPQLRAALKASLAQLKMLEKRFEQCALTWPFESEDIDEIVRSLSRQTQGISLALHGKQRSVTFALDQDVTVSSRSAIVSHGIALDSHIEEHNRTSLEGIRLEFLHDAATVAEHARPEAMNPTTELSHLVSPENVNPGTAQLNDGTGIPQSGPGHVQTIIESSIGAHMSASKILTAQISGIESNNPLDSNPETSAAPLQDTFAADNGTGGEVLARAYVFAFLAYLFPVLAVGLTLEILSTRYARQHGWNSSLDDFLLSFLNVFTGLLNLLLLSPIFLLLSNGVKQRTFWVAIIMGPVLLGSSVYIYYYGVISTAYSPNICDGTAFSAWSTGPIPQSFRGCEARVEPQQWPLFTEDVYKTQFPRLWSVTANGTWNNPLLNEAPSFDEELSFSVRTNQTLCSLGFNGYDDLYGLGVRTGMYLQWIASLLANNLLPKQNREVQKVYLVFSFSMCAATLVLSFARTCVFSIEIEILYWMYWGGSICVFASSPSQIKLGRHSKWIGLSWDRAILYTTHVLMTYHGIWFVWFAYDQVFARMPCGTRQFFLVPVVDPSKTFCFMRDYLTQLITPLALPLVLIIPTMSLLLASEIKNSIRDSAVYQMLFPRSGGPHSRQSETAVLDTSNQQLALYSRVLARLISIYEKVKRLYYVFRQKFGLPPHSRGGIRLVTPVDIEDHRNYRIGCAVLGMTSFATTVTAVEATLKWNKVVDVYSITSVGQYLPLTVGLSTLVSVCWKLIHQEAKRRRDLRRRQAISQDIELEPMQTTLAAAVRHAFGQPDAEFLTNDGALPPPSGAGSEEIDRFLDSLRTSTDVADMHQQADEHVMSGALDPV